MFHSFEVKGRFRPLQDWVILRPIKEPENKGGILLPDSARLYGSCEVMAVGPGQRAYKDGLYGSALVPTELKVGQFVYIQKFVEGEMRFNLNGQYVYAIRERHLSLVIEHGPAIKKSRKIAAG